MKPTREEILEDLKIKINRRKFKIGKRIYVPLHATNCLGLMKELKDRGFLANRGRLRKFLLKKGLDPREFIKNQKKTDRCYPQISCFEILKDLKTA